MYISVFIAMGVSLLAVTVSASDKRNTKLPFNILSVPTAFSNQPPLGTAINSLPHVVYSSASTVMSLPTNVTPIVPIKPSYSHYPPISSSSGLTVVTPANTIPSDYMRSPSTTTGTPTVASIPTIETTGDYISHLYPRSERKLSIRNNDWIWKDEGFEKCSKKLNMCSDHYEYLKKVVEIKTALADDLTKIHEKAMKDLSNRILAIGDELGVALDTIAKMKQYPEEPKSTAEENVEFDKLYWESSDPQEAVELERIYHGGGPAEGAKVFPEIYQTGTPDDVKRFEEVFENGSPDEIKKFMEMYRGGAKSKRDLPSFGTTLSTAYSTPIADAALAHILTGVLPVEYNYPASPSTASSLAAPTPTGEGGLAYILPEPTLVESIPSSSNTSTASPSTATATATGSFLGTYLSTLPRLSPRRLSLRFKDSDSDRQVQYSHNWFNKDCINEPRCIQWFDSHCHMLRRQSLSSRTPHSHSTVSNLNLPNTASKPLAATSDLVSVAGDITATEAELKPFTAARHQQGYSAEFSYQHYLLAEKFVWISEPGGLKGHCVDDKDCMRYLASHCTLPILEKGDVNKRVA
ncbi:hypothetical protein P3342_013182 [Pyrenophora teres f. teres]|nr:hypothetical protein P3342_013182 [Pyrenophora teres f. teres]